jgi:hypothetical protein
VHFGDNRSKLPVAVIAPEHRQRIEHMAQRTSVGEHQHAAAVTERDAVQRQERLDIRLDRAAGVAEMICATEP